MRKYVSGLLFMLMAFTCGAYNDVTITSNLHSRSLTAGNTRYIFPERVISVADTINVGPNCVLEFTGGYMSGVNLKLNNTEIVAPNEHIFQSCMVSGNVANSRVTPIWFGANSNASFDNGPAINQALAISNGAIVEMDNRTYNVNTTIHLKANNKLKVIGKLTTALNIDVLDFFGDNIEVDINEISQTSATYGDVSTFTGTALKFSKYCEHSHFKLNKITGFDKAIAFVPRKERNVNHFAGTQYLKFDFDYIWARYGIYYDLVTGLDAGSDDPYADGSDLWVNECQFNGGRLRGFYGVYVEKPRQAGNTATPWKEVKSDKLNGNVYNCIGFEDIQIPVTLYNAILCKFNNVRMSEDIHGNYLELDNCRWIDFEIKSMIPYEKISHSRCMQVVVKAPVVDAGFDHGRRLNRLLLDNTGVQNEGDDYALIGRDDIAVNVGKTIFYDNNDLAPDWLSLDDLLVTKPSSADVRYLSTFCNIKLYGEQCLNVYAGNTVSPRLTAEVTLRCNFGPNSRITFHKPDNTTVTINESGTYRLYYSRDNELKVEKVSN